MTKRLTIRIGCMIACIALGTRVFADTRNTPMQAFIDREKEANQFTTVSNIWQPDNSFDQTQLLKKVEKAQPLTIDYTALAGFMKDRNQDIQLVLPKQDGGTYTISLGRYDFMASGFKVVTNAKGLERDYTYVPGLYYRGVVDGIPGSVAAFSFFNNEVYGIFSIPNEGNYVLTPNTMVGNDYDYNKHYLLYNDNDLLIKNAAPKCSTDALPFKPSLSAEERTTTYLGNKVYNNCREVNVYELADYSTYRTKGSSVTNVANFTTAIFNNQSTLYRNEGILINLKYLKVDTDTDVYYSIDSSEHSIGFLTKFGQQTQNNLNGANVAILLSTKWGFLGGVAWLQSMCSNYSANQSYGPYAYCNVTNTGVGSFPTYSWNVEVVTHEMGHVVGSPHTHACVWNYPGRSTAIDGCYTLEGSCAMPNPQYPTAGGTIMSYCHLTSTGINFSNGFGKQPGDTIRYFLAHNTCGAITHPTTALAKAGRTITANRECLDPSTNITYYWNDNNTADQSDDTLALMIKKGSNNIGTLDSTGFSVKTSTVTGYGSGSGLHVVFPGGTANVSTATSIFAMRRYWQVTATTQPTSSVEVIFPFLATDTTDLNGSLAAPMHFYNMNMYKVNSPVDPNPVNGFNGLSFNTVNTYNYGSTTSTTQWSLTTDTSHTLYAHMLMSNLSGGGSGYINYTPLAINNLGTANNGIYFYPNPASDNWNLVIPQGNNAKMTLLLTAADGKIVFMQPVNGSGTYSVNAANLAPGIYFYRLSGDDVNATGSLIKSK